MTPVSSPTTADTLATAPDATTIGVDVGGTSTRVGVVDVGGHVLAVETTPTPSGAVALTDHLLERIAAMRSRFGGTVDAVGVGVPGRIDPATGALSMAVNLGISSSTPLRDRLASALDVPVVLGNDVDAAALGAVQHLGLGSRGLALVSVGTGLAAGFVLDGALLRGRVGAGEIGHVPVPGGRTSCRCGQVGCAETMASGAAMLRAWGREGTSIEALWDAADAGDVRAATIRENCTDTLAWLAQDIVMLLDVEDVLIGGGVSRLGDRLLEPVRERLEQQAARSALVASFRMPDRLRCAPADVELGVIGAATFAASASSTRAVTP